MTSFVGRNHDRRYQPNVTAAIQIHQGMLPRRSLHHPEARNKKRKQQADLERESTMGMIGNPGDPLLPNHLVDCILIRSDAETADDGTDGWEIDAGARVGADADEWDRPALLVGDAAAKPIHAHGVALTEERSEAGSCSDRDWVTEGLAVDWDADGSIVEAREHAAEERDSVFLFSSVVAVVPIRAGVRPLLPEVGDPEAVLHVGAPGSEANAVRIAHTNSSLRVEGIAGDALHLEMTKDVHSLFVSQLRNKH